MCMRMCFCQKFEHFTAALDEYSSAHAWWSTVPVMEGWGSPLICKQPEAYSCRVR